MKEHNIDQLFRQKLHQHTAPPTPAAWEKVSAGLNTRRRKRGGYYAAAAVVILLLSAGWFGLQHYQQEGPEGYSPLAVSEQTGPVQPTPAPADPSSTAPHGEEAPAAVESSPLLIKPQPGSTSAASLATNKVSTQRGTRSDKDKEAAGSLPLSPAPEAELVEAVTALAATESLPDLEGQKASLELPEQNPMALPATELALETTETVIIRYDASDAVALADAAVKVEDNERDSAPEKVLSIFQKVKHGEIGLADIRQAKDNLLSGRFSKP